MKLNLITQLARFPELTVALALVGSLVGLTAAAEVPSGKGAASLLMKPAIPQTTKVSKAMTCGCCSDVFVARKEGSARGANQPATLVAQHSCNNCATTIQTVGQGKNKHDVASHQCSMMQTAQAPSCCGTGKTATASTSGKSAKFQVAPLK